MAPSQHHEYTPVDYHSEDKDTEISLLGQDSDDGSFLQVKESRWYSLPLLILPWLLSLIFAASTLVLLIQRPTISASNQDTYNPAHDFINPATIPLEEVRFLGSPRLDTDGSLSHKPFDNSTAWPENVQYFGTPSPEIDENWNKLIEKRYFSISEEEAKLVWGDKYHEYVDELQGGYTAGLDVFHTLHCVNVVRQALHPEYYKASSHFGVIHVDHCLEILRQHVQCAGSTTLIPTKFYEPIRRNYIDSDQLHTCRSFTFLRKWSTSRATGEEAAVPRDPTNIDPRKHALVMEKIAEVGKEFGGNATDH